MQDTNITICSIYLNNSQYSILRIIKTYFDFEDNILRDRMGHGGTRRDMVRHHETLTCAMRAPGVPAASTQGRQDSARFRKLSMILVDYYRILKIIIDDIDVYIHIYIHLQIQLSKASAGF